MFQVVPGSVSVEHADGAVSRDAQLVLSDGGSPWTATLTVGDPNGGKAMMAQAEIRLADAETTSCNDQRDVANWLHSDGAAQLATAIIASSSARLTEPALVLSIKTAAERLC